jgi:hypothetical protein
MVNQGNLHAFLPIITPNILQNIMDWRKIDEMEAMKLLYNSELYKMLEIEETKLWHLSPYALAQFLIQELDVGKITWTEEQ